MQPISLRTALLCLIMLLAACSSRPAVPAGVAAPDSEVTGRAIGDWTAAWWRWALYAPDDPVSDTTGQDCAAGQTGPVWFLAGSFSTDPVIRRCRIPANTYVLFPLLNASALGRGCSTLRASVRAEMDAAVELFATIDDVTLPNVQAYRAAPSDCFDLGQNTAAADGYWVMLEPLAPGAHSLHFGGSLPDFRQDITYHLVIE